MRVLKWFGLGFLAILILGVVLNWTKIQRLMTVNTLFDADKIVNNFSGMDSAFLHHDLTIGEPDLWQEDLQNLPEMVMIAGTETNLAAALEELDTTALVVIRDGVLIHETYYKGTERDDLRISWSVAKSFMSGLYGQAIEDGVIDIEQPIETYLPQLVGTAYEGATVANILNMTSGVRFNEDYMDPKSDINDMGRVLGLGGSMDEYTTGLKVRENEPGTVWQYVSIDTHVAAMALREVTGKSLHQLWEETYGDHLGMGKAPFYLTDGKDVAFALGGLNLRTRDYAKFGQLFLQGGEWEGEQLIPEFWVTDSTTNHAPNIHPIRGTGYGYQWWVPMPQDGPNKGDFFAIGIYGQYIYVNPAMGIVIAKNAVDREFTQAQSNGQHSVNMNIDMFRSLAEQLAVESEPVSQGDFGELFGLLDQEGNLVEVTDEQNTNAQRRIRNLQKELKDNSNAIEPEWILESAECELRVEWVCEAKLLHGESKVTQKFFEPIIQVVSQSGYYGEADRHSYEVIEIVKLDSNSQRVVVETRYRSEGEDKKVITEVIFVDGEPQYQ